MTGPDIAQRRLCSQHISQQTFEKPGDLVQWLGAVQAQDYAAASWALGLRLQGATEADIEQAFASGAILRTHLMRPTWHFVSPADIRWLLTLTAPRVNAANAYQYRKLELDDALFARSNAALIKALEGGKQLTKSEIAPVLQQEGIDTGSDLRFIHIMFRAELDGIVCSGGRRGKQFTYALLDERVPQAGPFDRDAALAELAGRYFTGHSPATLQDFVWWSGLTVADARIGLEMVRSQLVYELVGGQVYWFSPSVSFVKEPSPGIHLLPNYDEYIVGYTERSTIFDDSHVKHLDTRGNVLSNYTIVLDGRVVGTWKRTIKKDSIDIVPTFFVPLNEAEMCAFVTEAGSYGRFYGKSTNVVAQME